jgi:hypothetical protein
MYYLTLALIGLLTIAILILEHKIDLIKQPRDSKGKFLPKKRKINDL